ncbi:hypothetical protein PF005_g5593 [Phytophthora fragariae]|uniref:Uncharacterized protein n=1 Tax=Phytophthora fragariae TaxID=53985 RepID=A0A6A3ENW1_9STRA|nr:hypothetical protein PF003_g4157 [Phytophthora fragariae]KAE8935155.1 hypothetical protein PF009_g14887 [Phytophthora fragariae]KAE8999295.1 hypothetical protein PF011_g14688 [Phytophthora fragariae]KAE9123235.1 hypothetical protein PF007_g7130 [Phytophthora fragariae]KAE9150754.1 hypothetical protein PF006_g4885 [Phytophthora fragariae]
MRVAPVNGPTTQRKKLHSRAAAPETASRPLTRAAKGRSEEAERRAAVDTVDKVATASRITDVVQDHTADGDEGQRHGGEWGADGQEPDDAPLGELPYITD